MKKNCIKLISLVFFGVFIQSVFAQKLEMKDVRIEYEKNKYPSIEVIVEPGTDEVKDAWENFIKKEYDVKMKGHGFLANKDVLYAEQVKFDKISKKEMDFYTKIVEEGDYTKINVFGSFGYDIPVSKAEYPAEYTTMENITKRFLQSFLPEYYQERIKNTEELLGDLKDDRKDMEDEVKDNEKKIKELTKRNKDLEKEIAEKTESIEKELTKLEEKRNTFKQVDATLKSFRENQ